MISGIPRTPEQAPTPSDLTERLAAALPDSGGQVELSAVWQQLDLTRFSGGRIHQNVVDAGVRVWARAWGPDGSGFSVTSNIEQSALVDLVEQARANAQQVYGESIELPGSAILENDPYFPATAEFGPEARAELARSVQHSADGQAVAHGNIRVANQSFALVNSSGLRTGYRATYAAMNLVAQSEGRSTGYAGAIGRDIESLDFTAVAKRATEIALEGRRPVVVEPGHYEVLLDPPAVSMLLVSLGYVGLNAFGASSARTGDAWFEPGKIVASNTLSLVDDPLDIMALFSPIDHEGTERARLTLIANGEAAGVAHDLASARADGAVTTGHALPPGDKGPSPHSLSIESGQTRRSELIAGMKKGLVVNRIHPFVTLRGGPDGELSGTTRDGVFLVEDGEIVAPVTNVRFSNSMKDLLGSVDAVSQERSVEFMDLPEFSPHTAHVPSLHSTHFTVHGTQPRER